MVQITAEHVTAVRRWLVVYLLAMMLVTNLVGAVVGTFRGQYSGTVFSLIVPYGGAMYMMVEFAEGEFQAGNRATLRWKPKGQE